MKNKGLLLATLAFFLLVNTSFYWEGETGLFAIPVFMLLVVVYLNFIIALIRQLSLAIAERFKEKRHFATIGLLVTILLFTYYKPQGIIDFEKFEANNVLVAEREGSANYFTTLKLKEDYTFKERIGCFGVTETKGTFRVGHDTIYFDNVQLARHEHEFYKFAVIRPSIFGNKKIQDDLIKYTDAKDTVGYILWITKNELKKLNVTSQTTTRRLTAENVITSLLQRQQPL